MSQGRPFIPRDKPKFWVIAIIAGLSGLGFGLLMIGAVLLALPLLKGFFIGCFLASLATFFVSSFGLVFGMLAGRYRGLTEKPWREQVW
ncbi:MAG: hypothetical protein D9V46_02180 [Deltaproteobacteria bacterium]|uniref:hypothetical protein n=1 Tax=Hydrosulfovibrio ferrireducens TaxID=2934181 RepID=UPI0012056DEF|nr:MAG: hypothetical protein D9V46_02180 [Deltaproteobacteria bacterium]